MPPIFEIGSESIRPIENTTFGAAGLSERSDLQRLLRDQPDVVAPDVLVISEEFGEWTDSRRRIDLLGVDKSANLVIIELKRTEDGGHMELQAVRYAAMVSTLTAGRAVEIFAQYLKGRKRDDDPEQLLLEHLDWDELDEDQFGQDVRLVLVSADFSRELTTAVMWLNEKDLDIRCVRIKPYTDQGRTLIDVQQIIPLPEAGDYQVQVREKKRQERASRKSNADFTRYDVTVSGKIHRTQWKRNAIFIAVRALYDSGVDPAEVRDLFRSLGRGNVFLTVPGEIHDVGEFRRLATSEADSRGKVFKERWWHLENDGLMPKNGQTHVLTKGWGRNWSKFMDAIQARYPQINLVFVPAGTENT